MFWNNDNRWTKKKYECGAIKVEDIQKKSVTAFMSIDKSIANERQREVVVLPEKKEEKINRNKPWRIVIRRNVVNGGGSDENIFGNKEHN